MKPIYATAGEEAVIELLERTGSCSLDDVITYLPTLSWGEVFIAVDRMSRDGRVLLHQVGYSTYRITLQDTSSWKGEVAPVGWTECSYS
jgi:hypothetical protein